MRSPKTIYLLLLLLLAVLPQTALPRLRQARLHLVILRNLVEEAAAPGEPILVDNWLLYRFLRSKGSPALREQLVLDLHPHSLPPELERSQEVLIVSTDKSVLVSTFRSKGYTLTPDAAQARWLASGYAVTVPGSGPLLIRFAAPPSPSSTSSQQALEGHQ